MPEIFIGEYRTWNQTNLGKRKTLRVFAPLESHSKTFFKNCLHSEKRERKNSSQSTFYDHRIAVQNSRIYLVRIWNRFKLHTCTYIFSNTSIIFALLEKGTIIYYIPMN